MRNGKRTTFALLAVALTMLVLVLVVGPAAAAGNTQVSGAATFNGADQCTELDSYFTVKMDGDLVGCWYTPILEVVHTNASGAYRERGEETFVGCLADGTTCGTFDTTYQFEARYTDDFSTEIRGHCEHKLVNGTGDFAGITGTIFFQDDVTDPANPIYNYRGHFSLP